MGDLYRLRWQVELFLKWIKLHLRIKAFFGTSENAVRTQIWIAVATYVLIAIVKRGALLPQAHALRGAGLVDLDEDEQQTWLRPWPLTGPGSDSGTTARCRETAQSPPRSPS